MTVFGITLVYMVAQMLSYFPTMAAVYALSHIVTSRIIIGLFDGLPGMPVRWESFVQLMTHALAFEAVFWWGRKFFFSNGGGELCIARYLAIPAILPGIALLWVLNTFARGYDEYGFLHRGGDFYIMFVTVLVGGLMIRGILVVMYKTIGAKAANIAAAVIAVAMLGISL